MIALKSESTDNNNMTMPRRGRTKKSGSADSVDSTREHTDEVDLSQFGYTYVDDIKVYDGVVQSSKQDILDRIEWFKTLTVCNKTSEMMLSTVSALGMLTNVSFTEDALVPQIPLPSLDYARILKIGCNYAELYIYPSLYVDREIDDILRAIYVLKGTNVKVGCLCQPMLDITGIYEMMQKIKEGAEAFAETLDTICTNCAEKRLLSKVSKTYRKMIKYKRITKDEAIDVYNAIETFVDEPLRSVAVTQVDMIISIISKFVLYKRACKCAYIDTTTHTVIKVTKRGRKPKDDGSTKSTNDTDRYFGSQISFDIYNDTTHKVTKIQLFRTGIFQVSGLKQTDMSDVLQPITLLRNYMQQLLSTEVKVSYLVSITRNYTCKIADDKMLLLNKLIEVMYNEKELECDTSHVPKYMECMNTLQMPHNIMMHVMRYIKHSFISIAEIINNCERYPAVFIKFNRMTPSKNNKKATIKVSSSGKISFDGLKSVLEALELYYWINYILDKYWDSIVYDPSILSTVVVSSDSDEYLSIYDDDA